jgi:hypothetical protein
MRPAGVMQPAGGGRKLGDVFFDEFFEYILTVVLTSSENRITSIPIQADAHFVWVSAYMNSSLASGSATFMGACVNRGGALVQITDGGTQRALSNAQVPADCLFGTAQRPYVLPLRKLFRANTSIGFNISNLVAAEQTVDFVLGGFKIPLGSTGGLLP